MYGYQGKYLFVDLSKLEYKVFDLDPSMVEKYLGGMGINLKLMQEYGRPGLDPYSPENPIIIGTGPFVGTSAPAACKTFVTTKYPLNNWIGTAVGGMNFARELKKAGFDHVAIVGQAPKPVYLLIEDGELFFKDAEDLWGHQDIYDTTDTLRERHGIDCSVISIGQAGENLVGMSLCLIDYIASLGKGGLAAVMGSKRLKAIGAKGSGAIRVADPEGLLEVVTPMAEAMKASPIREKMMTLGSMGAWPHWSETVGNPYKGWREVFPRDRLRERFGPDAFLTEIKTTKIACPGCYMPCKEIYDYTTEDGVDRRTYASSFIGRVTAFGARLDVGTIAASLDCHELCSRMGIDTYCVSSALDYLITLYEDGVIGLDDTDGFVLKRDYPTTMKLLEQIGLRQGVGGKLSDSLFDLEKVFGKKFEALIKGMDYIFDGRNNRLGTYEFEEVVNPRGAHQHPGGSPTYGSRNIDIQQMVNYCNAMGLTEQEKKEVFYRDDDFNVARMVRHCEEYYSTYNITGVCSRKITKVFYNMDIFSRMFACITGMEVSPRELKQAGERAWNLLKLLNAAEGASRADDRFPDLWFEPMHDGEEALRFTDYYGRKVLEREDLDNLLDDYYSDRGWSKTRGTPTVETLKKLGLEGEYIDLKNKNAQLMIENG
ncbi:MAG: hypothetical protein KKE29_09420 [Proteobacteria bacterium]|nr:hypothetical protein [Pseudomonadota bacterium]MBU4577131.1 hypothetical protein [Pseudomonadota bacterium]MBV1717026.1 hypothetical protein [Desulfarculus sp.]